MAKWKKGLSDKKLKEKDSKKGEHFKHPGDRISYIKKGVIRMFVPKEGKNRIRIVQPKEIDELEFYGLEMHFHRSVGDEGEDLFGDYLCSSRMKNILRVIYKDIDMPNVDYVCQQQTSELWDSNPDLAKTYYPDRRMWFLVQNLIADNTEEILLWSCPWTLHEEIVSRSTDEESGRYVDVSCPVEGVPVSFERTGKAKLTKYINVQVFSKASPLSDEVAEARIEFRDAIVIPSVEDVERAFLNLSLEDATPSRGQDSQEEGVKNEEAGAEETEDNRLTTCFKKEYDKYQDCVECDMAEECKKPPEKPKRDEIKKLTKPSRESGAAKDDNSSSDEAKKAAIRKNIKKSQKDK